MDLSGYLDEFFASTKDNANQRNAERLFTEVDEEEASVRAEALRQKEERLEKMMFECVLFEDRVLVAIRCFSRGPAQYLRAKTWFKAKQRLLRDAWNRLSQPDIDLTDPRPFVGQVSLDCPIFDRRDKQSVKMFAYIRRWQDMINEVNMEMFELRKALAVTLDSDDGQGRDRSLTTWILGTAYDAAIGLLHRYDAAKGWIFARIYND